MINQPDAVFVFQEAEGREQAEKTERIRKVFPTRRRPMTAIISAVGDAAARSNTARSFSRPVSMILSFLQLTLRNVAKLRRFRRVEQFFRPFMHKCVFPGWNKMDKQ